MTTTPATPVPDDIERLQAALAGEHAALYVYGVLGGRSSRSAPPALSRALAGAFAVHRARRDRLQVMVRGLGGEPVAPDVAYQLTTPAQTPADLTREAAGIESRCAQVYAEVVAGSTGITRQWAVDALIDAAVRELGFAGKPDAFPGLPEL